MAELRTVTAAALTAAHTTSGNNDLPLGPVEYAFLSGLFSSHEIKISPLLLLLAAPVFAHHSISAHYFMEQNIHLEGDVVEFSYINPHSFVRIEAKDPKTGQSPAK